MVLKAEELRLGNFATNTEENQCIRVGLGDLILINRQPNTYNAIPLDEEWLLKLGFTKHHDNYYNDVLMIDAEFDFKTYPNQIGSAIKPANSQKIKYVHQLQNLYFALTGKELTA